MSNDLEQELFGSGSSKKGKRVALAILIIFVASWLAYFYYMNYQNLHGSSLPKESKVAQRKEQITKMLLSARPDIDYDKARNGFWYLYTDADGIKHLAFFNLDKLSSLNLTDYQIQKILSRIKGAEIKDESKYEILSESELPDKYKFHNYIYSSPLETNYLNIKYTLEQRYKSGKYSKDDLSRLAYLYDLEGRFKDRDKIYSLLCSKYNERCASDKALITVTGKVTDNSGRALSGVKIKNLADAEQTTTDENGSFSLQVSAGELEKLRLLAEKPGYSDGSTSLIILTTDRKKYNLNKIMLSKIDETIIKLDTRTKKLLDNYSVAKLQGDTLVVNTERASYIIPLNSVRDENKKVFKGLLEVHSMFYNRDNAPGSLMNTDMFDSAFGYAGNRMYTFGMPYIKFFDAQSGKELFIYKDKPIVVRYRMLHLDELYRRGVITPAQFQAMVTLSHEKGGYPINRKYIRDNNILGFPTSWVFDRARGVWIEVGKRILDTNGLSETISYQRSF